MYLLVEKQFLCRSALIHNIYLGDDSDRPEALLVPFPSELKPV
jgi:hypothetical protein